jgi:gas vesicle protein
MAQDNTGNLIWFMTGAALGASIALLYAPQSGRDTRRLITKKARQSGDSLSEVGRDLADKGRDLYKKGRGLAEDAADMFERGRKLVEG